MAKKLSEKDGKLDIREFIDDEGNKTIQFRNKRSKDMVDSEYLKLIRDNYLSQDPEKKYVCYNDLTSICGNYRILDIDFINFLIEESNKDRILLEPLANLASRLLLDIDRYGE